MTTPEEKNTGVGEGGGAAGSPTAETGRAQPTDSTDGTDGSDAELTGAGRSTGGTDAASVGGNRPIGATGGTDATDAGDAGDAESAGGSRPTGGFLGLDAETRAAVAAALGQTRPAEEINDSIEDLIPTSTDDPATTAEVGSGSKAGGDPVPAAEPAAESVAEPPAEAAAGESQDGEGLVRDPLPDLTEDVALQAALEALLLVIDGPADEESLADALDQPVKRVRQVLTDLAQQYHEQDRGIDLRNVGGGWRFHTRDKFAPFVEKLLLGGQRAKLTRAALESLAVIAYRQPVTRARVAAVRGVNVDGVVRTLILRGLIEEVGTDKETGGILYRTTELFLERLGLSSLADLPPIAPLLPEVDAIDDV